MSPSPAQQIELACCWEAAARKPGNVHPEASFDNLTFADFVASAAVASPWLAKAAEIGVGPSVEAAIARTRSTVGTNTNLGIALLIAPLAAVPTDLPLSEGIGGVLNRLTVADAAAVYRAIRLAAPGGLGHVESEDTSAEPAQDLVAVMRLAAERDRIARQYVTNFADVLKFGISRFDHWLQVTAENAETSIIGLHLSLLAEFPDSLIARKCGAATAAAASQRSAHVLATGWPTRPGSDVELLAFDAWLRSDGHRRNPGTTADLVAATLFAHIREQVRTGAASPLRSPPTGA